MEPDRVEMSVGNGMVNGDHLVNGAATNGSPTSNKSQGTALAAARSVKSNPDTQTNGEPVSVKSEEDGNIQAVGGLLQDAPQELLQALSAEFYLPMARLISRSAQSCWNDLSMLVERLATMPVPNQNTNSMATTNDQSKVNLDKKDLLLNFAKDHKDVFIKMLVLLQWSRRSEAVRKTIELNLWLQQRRQAFNNATAMLGAMMRGLADSQIPNPDLYTAAEVLATGTVFSMPKLDYVPQPSLTSKQALRILRRLDTILCTRMALMENIPSMLQLYHIHDGRVTFTIKDEFRFDVSVASEDPEAKFGMVDFAFLFSPTPAIPDGLHNEITYITNSALDKDGFEGVYSFLHDLTLSYKLSELAKQARRLSQGLWNGQIRVEVLRRTLVIQYWVKSSVAKSWLEIGIHSGRKQDSLKSSLDESELQLRWLREGKISGSEEIKIDPSQLSIENLLRQVIAQHTNYLFDAIYDKLVLSPLYKNAELELSQSVSMSDPSECILQVQLSKVDVLHVCMEPIGGSLILSPVNEKISKMQFDLSRSKTIVDDFIARVSNLRSSTAESNLNTSLPNSQWQRLESVKLVSSEAERLFGQVVSRVTFIRQPDWTPEWVLAVTQSITGDVWWLIQTTQPNSMAGSHITKIVKNTPLHLNGSPSPAYLEKLGDYTTGVIALQCNAEYLNKNKFTWRLPDIPTFDGESRLPALQFSRHSSLPTSIVDADNTGLPSNEVKPKLSGASTVHLTYHGVDSVSKKVVMVAKAALVAESAVLRDLASSQLDRSVAILPEKQQLMIQLQSDAGVAIIESLVSKLSHLENIVACAAAVKRSTEHTLQSLSLSSITILYHKEPDLSLLINFGHQPNDLSASFLPAATNPHRHLSQWVAKSMRRKGQNSRQSLSHIFVVLRMTWPIMSYLQKMQSPGNHGNAEFLATDNHLRIHILHRQPTAYALHYFADSSNFVRDETGPGTPQRLLARFEILAMRRGERLMWMVRPAIEEFNSYNRPSYTSKTLREKLDREIFKKQNTLWLALDGGAACPSDKPDQLLSAIHNTIVKWAKEAVKPEAVAQQLVPNTSKGINVDNSNEKRLSKPNVQSQTQKSQNMPQQRPNGIQKPQQPIGHQRPQAFSKPGPRQSDVITID